MARLLSCSVEALDIRIVAVDLDYRITALSSAYREDFERRFGAAVGPGTDLREVFGCGSSCRPDCVIEHWRRALSGEEFTAVVPAGDAECGPSHHEASFQPLRGPDGEVEGACQVVRDVTAREAAREEAERRRHAEAALRESRDLLQAVLDASADAVFVKDTAGRYLMINPAGARMVGRSVEEVIGRDDYEVFEPATAERAIARDREVLESGESRQSQQAGMAAGTERVFVATKSPLRDASGRIIGLVGVARDVTESHRAEQELRRERELLERIIDTIPVMIAIYDPEQRGFRVNRELERLIGWTREEIAGLDLMEACYPDPEARATVRRFMKSLEEGWRDFEMTTRDGETIETSWANVGLSDNTRVGIGLDIRERRRTERALRFLADASATLAGSLEYEETLRQVAELAVPDIADWCAVDLIEADGEIRRVAIAHRDEERKRLAERFLRRHPHRLDSKTGVGAVIRTGRPQVFPTIPESVYRRAAGDPERLRVLRALDLRSILVVPFEAAGTRFGALSLVQSDSGRRFSQADLPLAEELARRAAGAIQNARAYRAEHQARTAAERANQSKDQFLAVMSHELRTPLTAVMGYADLLALGVSGALNERQHDHVARIQHGALHLTAIIEEILTYARTEVGKEEVRVATVDTAAIARDVAALLLSEAEAKGVALRAVNADDVLPMDTDGGKVRRILVNLVGNAVKFTDRGEVVLELDASAADRIELRIRDTGPGIAADQLDRIFEPFTQLDGSITREQGGIGLGLTVCRKLARLLGGDITVESEPGIGSTFTVRLPRRCPAAG